MMYMICYDWLWLYSCTCIFCCCMHHSHDFERLCCVTFCHEDPKGEKLGTTFTLRLSIVFPSKPDHQLVASGWSWVHLGGNTKLARKCYAASGCYTLDTGATHSVSWGWVLFPKTWVLCSSDPMGNSSPSGAVHQWSRVKCVHLFLLVNSPGFLGGIPVSWNLYNPSESPGVFQLFLQYTLDLSGNQ